MKVNYKFYVSTLIFIFILSATVNFYKKPLSVGLPIEFAEKRLNEILKDSTKTFRYGNWKKKTLVTSKETAIDIVEPILFDLYGKEQILSERPYGVHKIGDYWFISGSLPRYYDFGGGFEIILDSRDAMVLSVAHYK